MGRPSDYSQETADEICEWLANGKSLRSYCDQEGKPVLSTVLKWRNENSAFSEQYARAREMQAESLADEITDIADGAEETPDAKRVRIDARKWAASKLAPKKFGEKITHAGDPENPLEVKHSTNEELLTRLGQLGIITPRFSDS